MGVRILYDEEKEYATLFCSTSDWSFGPVVGEDLDKDPRERLHAFLQWATKTGVGEVRRLTDSELEAAWGRFRGQEADWYAKEKLAVLEQDELDGVLLKHERAELAVLRIKFHGEDVEVAR